MVNLDENEVRRAVTLMHPDGQIFEVRVIAGKKVFSGYFRDADTLLKELKRQPLESANVYATLNTIEASCYDRSQRNKFEANSAASTKDDDIIGYNFFFVDVDPVRKSGLSATNEQIEKAKLIGNKVYAFMDSLGFEKPITAFSGNGVHLQYPVKMKNTKENAKLIEKALKTLDMMFSDEDIKIDHVNFNPSRVCKLYGTVAHKGSNTEKRPHRMSRIVSIPAEIKTTDIVYIQKLCSYYPEEQEKPQRYNNYSPQEFDLESWMDKYNLRYKTSSYADGTKYILDCCPFDSNHKGKDATIFRSRSGAIGFKCLHNSCSDKKWKDVRMLFESDAYEKKWKSQEQQMYGNHNRNRAKEKPKPIEKKDGVPIFYTASDIINLPHVEEEFIKTGVDEIDKKMRGLKKTYVSVVSGLRGSAKSTWLSGVALNAVNSGNNVGFYSGELSERNFLRWMMLQAAGKANVEPSQFEGYYNVPKDKQQRIAEWLSDKLWLYNNAYGNNFQQIIEQFRKKIDENKLDLLILDNLMAFDISSLSENKYEAQTAFVWALQKLAKDTNTHIIFVAHPRKAVGFLRLNDISGTADIGNAVDNAFIVHRVNEDYKRMSKEMFKWKDEHPTYQATNAIEIAKDRDGGTQDCFIPLYYEPETKRLKNTKDENKTYGWVTDEVMLAGFEKINIETDDGMIFD